MGNKIQAFQNIESSVMLERQLYNETLGKLIKECSQNSNDDSDELNDIFDSIEESSPNYELEW